MSDDKISNKAADKPTIDINDPGYIFRFTLNVCLISGLLVTLAVKGLEGPRLKNQDIDKKRKILSAAGFPDYWVDGKPGGEINSLYNRYIGLMLVDRKGRMSRGVALEEAERRDDFLPVYVYREKGKIISFCFPIKGQGLWDEISGFVSLDKGLRMIKGISFYEHAETPGLGARIEEPLFRASFIGKRVWDGGTKKFRAITVLKSGGIKKISGEDKDFYVDGISGATITSEAVGKMVNDGLARYEGFIRRMRK